MPYREIWVPREDRRQLSAEPRKRRNPPTKKTEWGFIIGVVLTGVTLLGFIAVASYDTGRLAGWEKGYDQARSIYRRP